MKNTNKKVTIKDNNNTQPLTNNFINTTGKPLSKHQTVLSQPKVFGNRVSSSTTQTINNNYKKTSTKKQQGTPKTNKGSFINNAITNPGIKRTTRLKQSSIVSSITGSVNYNHKSSIQSTDFSKTPFAGELKCSSGTKVPDEEVLIVHVHNHTESNVNNSNKNHSKQTSPYLKKNKTKQIYTTAKTGNTNSNGSSNTKSISNGLFVDGGNNNYIMKTHTTEEDDNSPMKGNNNNVLPTTQTFTEITQDNNNVMLPNSSNNNNVTTPKTSRITSKEHGLSTNFGSITQTKSTPNLVNHTFNININNNNAVIIPSCSPTNTNTNPNNIYSHSNEIFLQKILEMFISLKPNISTNNEDILTDLFIESQIKFKELETKINNIIITNSINHKQIQTHQDHINEIYLNSQTRIEIYKTYFDFIYNILNEIKYITTREINHDLILKQIDEVNSNTKSKLTNTCNVNESICEEKTNLILPMGGNIFMNNKQIVENELSEFISSIHSEFYQKLIFDDEKKKTKIYNNNNNNICNCNNHLDDTPLQYSKKNFFPKKKNSQKSCDSNDQTIKMSEDDYSSTIIRDDDSIKESVTDNNKCIRKVNEIHPNQIINQVNINNQNRKQLMKYCNNNNTNTHTNTYNQVGRNIKPPLQKGKTNDNNNNNENNCNVF